MKIVLGCLVAALSVGLAFVWTSQSSLREENRALLKQLEGFTSGNAAASTISKSETAPVADTNEVSELVRLRGEVTRLRQEAAEAEKARAEVKMLRAQQEALKTAASKAAPAQGNSAPKLMRKEDWSFAGFADAPSALKTMLWAGATGDLNTFLGSMTPEELENIRKKGGAEHTDEKLLEQTKQNLAGVKSVQILAEDVVADDEVVLRLFLDGDKELTDTPKFRFKRVNNEWRMSGND